MGLLGLAFFIQRRDAVPELCQGELAHRFTSRAKRRRLGREVIVDAALRETDGGHAAVLVGADDLSSLELEEQARILRRRNEPPALRRDDLLATVGAPLDEDAGELATIGADLICAQR